MRVAASTPSESLSQSGLGDRLSNQPVGTGPFLFERWNRDAQQRGDGQEQPPEDVLEHGIPIYKQAARPSCLLGA